MGLSKILYLFFPLIVCILLLLYFFKPIGLDMANSDLGRHLLMGKIMIASGQIPKVNLLASAAPNSPFINTHWLSEVIFYMIFVKLGFNGLILLSVLTVMFSFLPLFIFSIKRFNLFVATAIAILYIQILSERTDVRPELFSFLLLSIFLIILYSYKNKYTIWIFALIPLEAIWVNLHIYFIIGPMVASLFLVDAFFQEKRKIASKKFLTYIGVISGVFLATLLNPNFFKGAVYSLFALNNYGFEVKENLNFFSANNSFKDPVFVYFGISVFLLFGCLLISIKKIKLIDVLLSISFTYLAIYAVRNFPLFVFGTFIPFSNSLSYIVASIFKKNAKINKYKIILGNLAIVIIIFIAVVPVLKWHINNYGVGFGIIDNSEDAVYFLIKNKINGPIFNNVDIGNYIEYRLYPQEKAFVDARPEAYSKKFFQEVYFPMQMSFKAFKEVDKKYKFNIIFLSHTDLFPYLGQMIDVLVKGDEWKMVYLNNQNVIFIKNNSQNKQIIEKYYIFENNSEPNKADLKDTRKIGQWANFFSFVGWEKQQLAMYIKYLDLDPKNCIVLKNINYLMEKNNTKNSDFYIDKYRNLCN